MKRGVVDLHSTFAPPEPPFSFLSHPFTHLLSTMPQCIVTVYNAYEIYSDLGPALLTGQYLL
jgi:hypothetical protein